MKIQQINHREAFGFWLNELGLKNEVAEIGCAQGVFARTVLSQWKGKTYYMIDCWCTQDKERYKENQEQQEGYDKWYEDCKALAETDPRVQIIKEFSVEASAQFEKGQLDAVYIDANHAYGAVLADMDAWWPKVKIGGLMAGHDYTTRTTDGAWTEVEAAVKRWASEHGKVFYVCPCTSWFIPKQSP